MQHPEIITSRGLTQTEAKDARQSFPNINTSAVRVIGEADSAYNCLAWTLGLTNVWVWPWNGDVSLDQFHTLYKNYGWKPANGGTLAAYGVDPSRMTHGSIYTSAMQSASGGGALGSTWTSKLGKWLLITHTLGDLAGNGSLYGNVQQFYDKSVGLTTAGSGEGMVTMSALSTPELDVLRGRIAAVSPGLRHQFDAAYRAWEHTWSQPRIACSDDPGARAKSPEFYHLIMLGPDIVPLLMEKLCLPEQFFALQAVVRLVPPDVVFSPQVGDVAVLGGEQLRARETIKRWVLTQRP